MTYLTKVRVPGFSKLDYRVLKKYFYNIDLT